MDSPITHAPVGPQEKPILEKLLMLRDKLLLLKQDKSTYVKSQDVIPVYDEIIEQIHVLNDVRGSDHLLQNRVDTVLDDCLQLISLFFMAVGRNNEAPGIYAVTSTITRLCEHLKEAAFYSKKDLDSLDHTIGRMEDMLQRQSDKYSPYLLTRIQYRLEICRALLKELRDFLSTLSPEMAPVWEKLVAILRSIAALNIRSKVTPRPDRSDDATTDMSQFSLKDLNELRNKLKEIQSSMHDGKLPGEDGSIGSGQDLVVPLLERCLRFCDLMEEK
jgi:hypothetical protein